MRPHTTINSLYMCPHTTIYAVYMCPHTSTHTLAFIYEARDAEAFHTCPHTTVYSLYTCPHTTTYALYMCPHSTIYAVYTCPHTSTHTLAFIYEARDAEAFLEHARLGKLSCTASVYGLSNFGRRPEAGAGMHTSAYVSIHTSVRPQQLRKTP